MIQNQRRTKRFAATAFINKPVMLKPILPYFGHAVKGKLIDLSAGGMAVLVHEFIPQGTLLDMTMTFPTGFQLLTLVNFRYVLPKGKNYLHGIEFLNMPAELAQQVERMSADYINCESRIQSKNPHVCQRQCSFYELCTKPEKLEPTLVPLSALELELRLPPAAPSYSIPNLAA